MPLSLLDSDQKLAAVTPEAEVAVTAGAGSGKTRLLVGRYLYLVGTLGVSPEKVVAITFTEKAASHMKAAVMRGARDLADTDSGRRGFWRSVADTVPDTPISTIHAFCNGILRRYPVEAGLDPLYGIIDDTAARELAGEIVDASIRSLLNEKPEDGAFLAGIFGMRGLRRLFRALLSERPRLTTMLDSLECSDPTELEARYIGALVSMLDRRIETIRDFHATGPGEDTLTFILDTLLERLGAVRDTLSGPGHADDAPEAVRTCLGLLKSVGGKGSAAKWSETGVPATTVRRSLKELRLFIESIETFLARERGVTARAAVLLMGAFRELSTRFLTAKKARSALDHDDTLVETWTLLRTNVTVLREVAAGIRHILVDEFQDTDAIQMDILRMISGNSAAGLFTVGDPKQSIYRFRGADIAIFHNFVAGDAVDFKKLSRNYRSAPGIVSFVNRLFSRVMGDEPVSGDIEALYRNMKSVRGEDTAERPVEIMVIEGRTGEECRRTEAATIAARIRELHEQDGYSYGDMALISRKGTTLKTFEETLLAADIPFVNSSGGDPFSRPEALDIGTLLGWLADPHDPVLFCGLLLSPFFGVPEATVHGLVHAADGAEALPDAFLADDTLIEHPLCTGHDLANVRDVLVELSALRDVAGTRDVLETAFELTDFTLVHLADPVAGEVSLAVIDHILERADSFEADGGAPEDFARLLRDGDLRSDRMPAVDPRGDALTIMTIHKAKGLEFKVVFLADVTGKPRRDDRPLVFDKRLGPGFSIRDEAGNSLPTLVRSLTKDRHHHEQIAESKRLFYVGCTRAEDRLVISGGVKGTVKTDPAYEKDTWMGWLHTALDIPEDADASCMLPGVRYERVSADGNGGGHTSGELPTPVTGDGTIPVDADITRASILMTSDPAPHTEVPVSCLTPSRIMAFTSDPETYHDRHKLDTGDRTEIAGNDGRGAAYGTLAHRVLELWDFDDPAASAALVDVLADDSIPAKARTTLRGELERFGGSPLAKRIARAETVLRETPFACILPDGLLLRGTIDCLFRDGDGWHIVDYKTDAVEPEDASRVADRYRMQISLYALALERAEYELPCTVSVHFLGPDITCEIPVTPDMTASAAATATDVARRMGEPGEHSTA
jgi:ATP-dependent helicase/nuclease subunit A